MNVSRALEILKNTATPRELSKEAQDQWIEAISYFGANIEKKAIPMLIKTFGEGDFMEIYLCIQVTLQNYHINDVLPHLIKGLSSRDLGVRCWSADTIRYFPRMDAIPALTCLLHDKDPIARYEAAVALECISHRSIGLVAAEALMRETDEHVRDVLRDLVQVA